MPFRNARTNANAGSTSVSTTYSLVASDVNLLCDASSAGFVVTLLSAAVVAKGRPYVFKKTDATANEVTLTPAGSETIDGAPGYALGTANEAVTLKSDGTNWYTA